MDEQASMPETPVEWFADDSGFEVRSKGFGHVVVAFGGLRFGGGTVRFEFLRLLDGAPVDLVAVRDVHQCWYQRGIAGLGDTLEESGRALGSVISALRPRVVTTVGASAGGFAALAMAALSGADRAIAFSPQTFLGRTDRLRHRDFRWRRQVRAARKVASGDELDVRHRLGRSSVDAVVHYGARHRLDVVHATRLRGLPNVRLVAHPSGSHHLVQDLRRNGQLLELILDRGGA